jgi:autotransporter-associated beta strand protein
MAISINSLAGRFIAYVPRLETKTTHKNMKPMKSVLFRNFLLLAGLLWLGGAMSAQTAGVTWTNIATGNWNDATKWTNPVVGFPNAAGDAARPSAGGFSLALTGPITLGQFFDSLGSAGAWTITGAGPFTMDNTGGNNNPAGDANAFIGQSSSGTLTLAAANIIIANTDLDIANTGSTTPTLAVGTLGTTTITATTPQNLFIRQNVAGASGKSININSSIGGSGSSVITVQNVGTSASVAAMNLNGVVGPNASIVQNAATTVLSLNNAANSYTGGTTITLGTLKLGAANAIPSVSSVSVTGTLNLAGFSDTLDALTGGGMVTNSSTTAVSLTVGGNNSSGTFNGIIVNNGALSLAKTGSGTEILSGLNTYSGTTTFKGGFLNAGGAENPGVSGPFGSANAAGSLVFGGGSLQYSAANQNDYSSRFSPAANQPISIDTAGQNIAFGAALTSSGGSLTKVGNGTLTLNNAETYSGNTTINGGTLALGASAALAGSSTISIGAGGTLDVSALASPYVLGGSAGLKAGGTGLTLGAAAANIVCAAGGVFDLGSRPVSLTWGGGSSGTDSAHPALLISSGSLNLNGNTITVVVPGAALTPGVYTLISAPAITGAPSSIPSYTGGNGVALGNGGTLSVSGSTVILTVAASAGVVGTWDVDSDGNWSDGSKWSGGVPNAAKDTAILGTGSALRTVSLDANESVGVLTMNNINSFVIADGGKTLTLDNSGAGAAVSVTAGTANAIQTAVSLNDNTVVTVNSGKSLALSGGVNSTGGTPTLTFNGAGTSILSGANRYGPAAGSVGTILSAGGTLQLANSSALGAGDVSVSGNSKIMAGAAGLSVGNNLIFADATTVDNNGNNLTLSGVISGAGALTKTGNHTLTLSGHNTYSGNTTVNGGTLSVSSANNVPDSPAIILNGGSLLGNGTFAANNNIGIGPTSGAVGTNALMDAASGQTVTLNGVMASAGNGGTNSLWVNSLTPAPGTVVLNGANTFNGNTVIANGTLELDNALALQNSTLIYNTGTLVFGNGIAAATLGGLTGTNSAENLLLNNGSSGVALTVGDNNVSTSFGGNLTDGGLGGSLILNGTGTMTVSNVNYTGNTTVNSSSTLIVSGGSFGSSGSTITVGSAGNPASVASTLTLTGGTATASQVNVGKNPNGTGCSLNINGTGSAVFNNVQLGATGNTGGHVAVNTTGTVSLGSYIAYKDTGGAAVSTTTGLMIQNGAVTAASIDLEGNNHGANLNITGGSLTIGDSSSTGAFKVGASASVGAYLTMSGGTLTYLGADGLLASSGGGVIGVVSITGGAAILTGVSLNSSTGANSLTLSNAALYLGNVGLVIANPSATSFASLDTATVGAIADWSASAPITLTNAVTFQAADAASVAHNISLGGVLSGAGTLTKTGNGVLTLSGTNTYTGNTLITKGTLALGSAQGVAGSPNLIVSGGAVLDVSAVPFVLGGSQTLQGNGMNIGTVGTASGAKIYAGTDGTYGTNTFNNNLNFGAGAGACLDVGTVFNGSNDLVVVGGNLTLSGNNLHLKAPNAAANLDPTADYVLFTVAGTLAGSFLSTPVWDVAPANASRFAIVTDQVNKRVLLHAYAAGVVPPSGMGSASPSTVYALQTSLISVTVTPGTSPTITSVVLETSSYGGSAPVALVLSGLPNVYTNTIALPGAPLTGSKTLTATITDAAGVQGVAAFTLNVQPGRYWNGQAGDNHWSSGANWLGGTAPQASGDSVTFAGVARLAPDMDQAYSVAGLTFDPSAGAFTLGSASGSPLTLAGDVNNNSPQAQILNMPVDLAGVPTINTAANDLTLNGVVSGGGFIKAGTNTLTLTNANSFSGGMTLNGTSGTLALLGDYSGGMGGGQISVAGGSTVLLGSANAAAVNTLNLLGNSSLKLRADTSTSFLMGTPITAPSSSGALNFDVNNLTAGITNQTLSLTEALTFSSSADQTINVTGNSTYALALGAITLTSASHSPFFSLNVNTLPAGPAVTIGSVTYGNWGNALNLNGGGKVTITGNLIPTSNGEIILFVNHGTTATLQGMSQAGSATADGNKYGVINGTLVLDDSIYYSGYTLRNNTTGTGLTRSVFILGAATNVLAGSGYTYTAGVLTATNNSFNAAVYLGAANSAGGMTVNATLTNNVSDGDVGFTNSGSFTIGAQNTSGVNYYFNPIILGWTANRGKSVTLVAATGGEVDFYGGIFQNGTDTTAGVMIGNGPDFAGVVKFPAANTYGGATRVNNGTLALGTADSLTNSTPVSVSAGATLDVTALGGYTLGQIKPQTLKGNGTVNGSLTTLAGSTLAPGNPVGALTVTGNATLGGLLVLNLNRTNTPINSSRLSVTGTLTAGGTLAVTNIGPALQAGDTFPLFNGGVSGFTAVTLATNDANQMIYTWQNNLAANGSIKVLTVVPIVSTNAATANFRATTVGSSLQFNWAPDHLGWQLYTNAAGLTAAGGWFPVPGSAAVTNETITINPANPNVFFQLRYP